MTTETTGAVVPDPSVGATTDRPIAWHQINWCQAERTVRRLQTRIAQATQEGRWGRVKALQRLLTHSFSGKALAVRRVTENTGKRTPGVDGETWKTPEQKAAATHTLTQRGYRPLPLRRVYIPKNSGGRRPLSIPMIRSYCLSFQESLGMSPGAAWQGGEYSSTLLLLYHKRQLAFQRPLFPAASNGLAQSRNEFGSERDPTRSMRRSAHRLQFAELAPLGNGRDIHIEQ